MVNCSDNSGVEIDTGYCAAQVVSGCVVVDGSFKSINTGNTDVSPSPIIFVDQTTSVLKSFSSDAKKKSWYEL